MYYFLHFSSSRLTLPAAINEINICFETARDYTFVIRDYLGSVQADGKVSNLSNDIKTVISDIRGSEILKIRKRVDDSTNLTKNFLSRIFEPSRVRSEHIFEVSKHGSIVGTITFVDKEPAETCLKMYLGDAELVVKSLTMGEFAVSNVQTFISLSSLNFVLIFKDIP